MSTKFLNLFIRGGANYYAGFLFSVFALFLIPALSVNPKGQELQRINENPQIQNLAGIDKLGNVYSIFSGELRKFKPDGSVLTYSNRQLGHPTFVDVSDPLNILLYFGDFGSLLLLDRNLSVKSTIKESSWQGFSGFPSLVAYSTFNGFWAYFPDDFNLSRFDMRGNRILSGVDLMAQNPTMGLPRFMVEYGEKLFLSANGIWVFDPFATLLFHIPHIMAESFMVRENNIFYLSGDALHVYNFFLEKENVILLPEENVVSFFVENNRLIFLQTEVSLHKYKSAGKLY